MSPQRAAALSASARVGVPGNSGTVSRRWKFLAPVLQTLEDGGPGGGNNVAASATAACLPCQPVGRLGTGRPVRRVESVPVKGFDILASKDRRPVMWVTRRGR